MRKNKLKCIEDYIFAKTLNLLAKNTHVSRENAEIFQLINYALAQSEQLLIENMNQINKLKLNNVSFLILKNELENANIFNNQERNIEKIKDMCQSLTQGYQQ